MSFKPFRFYSNDAKYDGKITEYNKTKIIRIDPSTYIEFEEAKGEAEIKSNIKSFIKNKARFSISTNEKFNFEIRKNDQQVESFTDIDEYVLENWNYNSNVGLSPEKRIENNNKYNISAWSKIPVRKYKNVNGRIVLKREIIGGNKIQDFLNGENNLLLIHELVNQGGKYYYRKYKCSVQ